MKEKKSISALKRVELILETKDIDYIKECVFNENMGLYIPEKVYLIKATHDVAFIKQCINDTRLNFDSITKAKLIIETRDSEYIKQSIYNEEFAFSLREKAILISATHDLDLIKKYINNDETSFTLLQKAQIIKDTNDPEFISQCIQDKELDKQLRASLIILINDEKIYEEEKNKYDIDDSKVIKLPPEMTFGIEIESEGTNKEIIKKMMLRRKWRIDEEASLEEGKGIELVSPILKSGKEDTKEIYVMCNILSDLGQNVSNRCGAHIHVGADYLKSKAAYINLLSIWGNTESIIYRISNPPGQITRIEAVSNNDDEIAYAPLISRKIELAIESGEINIDENGDLSSFIEQLKNIQNIKYSGINFLNIGKQEKNTIEFRTPNGTLNPKTWVENINLFGGIIKAAEEIAQIQKMPIELISEEEKIKLNAFQSICSENLSEKEKLNLLLELCVSEEQKDIYVKRYEENNQLYRMNSELENIIENTTSRKPIMPIDIGKRVFVEDNITGTEMQNASNRLKVDLIKENTKDKSKLYE